MTENFDSGDVAATLPGNNTGPNAKNLKRKRLNRTGWPTKRRRKTTDAAKPTNKRSRFAEQICDRVQQTEAKCLDRLSDTNNNCYATYILGEEPNARAAANGDVIEVYNAGDRSPTTAKRSGSKSRKSSGRVSNYRKLRTNVYGKSVRPKTSGIEPPICECQPDVGCGDRCLNRMVYMECSPSNCPCGEKCRNQRIQRHEVAPGVERFLTANKGWGIRTNRAIATETFILEHVGEVISKQEFRDRMRLLYNYDEHQYGLYLDGGLVIDGYRMGSDGRFVNHSCEPNCEMQKWSVNGLSRMALFAKRQINEGEELTYDYNFSLFNPSEGQPCRCNTANCRGVIGGKSQRVKPLPMDAKTTDVLSKENRNGRQRKRTAKKNAQRLQTKDVIVTRGVQQLSEKEKKLIKQHSVFLLRNFQKVRADLTPSNASIPSPTLTNNNNNNKSKSAAQSSHSPTEDIIGCICGLYKDEGVMIQCARCMVWQHTECTKADVDAEKYLCERCEPRTVDREIPLDEYTDEGHRYYLTLMRGDLHVRQGDAVYVLRDIPIKDASGNVVPSKKHTYETIGDIDYNECDIFRVERLWKNKEGKRFIFGHHFLRPHETFHEPSRRFYPNEVVRVPLYEVVPIELVIGRCWVLDRTTFCKGRPIECGDDDEHCYICELRVDKSARFFSKAKVNYPTCTKSYAFRKFPEKLKISKSYAPHDVDPSMLKSKKQQSSTTKTDSDALSTSAATSGGVGDTATGGTTNARSAGEKPLSRNSPAASTTSPQVLKAKRTNLENVLKVLKAQSKEYTATAKASTPSSAKSADLSYLLSGRGARQRKP